MTTSDPSKSNAPASQPGDDSPPSSQQPADPPASTPAPASSPAPDSAQAAPPDSAPASAPASASGDCAEIPTACHAVLEAAIKIVVELPFATTDSSQPAHQLTLSNEDGSYSKTLSFPSDCQPGEKDGTCIMTFDGLNDGHTYTLQGGDDAGTYAVLDPTEYHQIVPTFGAQGGGSQDPPPDWAPPMDGSGFTSTGDPGGADPSGAADPSANGPASTPGGS
jgi:hypothetical protein